MDGTAWALANQATATQAMVIGWYNANVDSHGVYQGNELTSVQINQIAALWQDGTLTNSMLAQQLATILVS